MPKRQQIRFDRHPALVIHKSAFRDKKLVYIARANRGLKYPWGHNRIAYIGTTKNGAQRIASSAAWKGEPLLYKEYGIRQLEFHVVTCGKVQGVETWRKLERALLIKFKELYGAIPRANRSGKNSHWKDERRYFSVEKLERIIKELG